MAIRCDITHEDERPLVARGTAEHPELSVLINNAGRAFTYTHGVGAGALANVSEVFATNYEGRLLGEPSVQYLEEYQ